MNDSVTPLDKIDTLNKKVEFLSQRESYGNTTGVEALETHMSWVFLTDKYVYKLKKPVCYQFLDFTTLSNRYRYCMEEVRVNQPLAGDVYVGVVPLLSVGGSFRFDGKGEVTDWLVKMKRLPRKFMLDVAIKEGTVRNEWVRKAAEKLVDFYLQSTPISIDATLYRQQLIDDIELNRDGLSAERFGIQRSLIGDIASQLLDFASENSALFAQRIVDGRIIDAHGDLRPDHICLGPSPVIIDRLEFNSNFRVMDIAEELAFLSLECDMLLSPETGSLFHNIYQWESRDKVPEMLIEFFKAKRAFLRARLSINHLLEEKYLANERKWRGRCEAYLNAAVTYCECLPNRKSTI